MPATPFSLSSLLYPDAREGRQPCGPISANSRYRPSLLVNYGAGNQNIVTGLPPNIQNGVGSSYIGTYGKCKTGYGAGAPDIYSFASCSSFTMIAVFDMPATGNYSPILGGDDSSNRQFQLRLNTSNVIEFIRFNTAASNFSVTTSGNTTRRGVVIAVSNGSSFKVRYGGVWTSSGTISGTPQPLTKAALNGAFAFDQSPTLYDRIFSAAVLPYALSDSECLELESNPWMLFDAPVNPIWFASPNTNTNLGATAQSVASTTGALSVSIGVVGSSASIATDAGAITVTDYISGSSAAISTINGAPTVQVSLSGAALSQALAQAAANIAVPIGGNAGAVALDTGAVNIQVALSGADIAQAAASGSLSISGQTPISGAASSSANMAGLIGVNVPLAGSASALATDNGSASVVVPVSGVSVSVATDTGNLSVSGSINLSGGAIAQALDSGSLSISIPISAAALSQSLAAGRLLGIYGMGVMFNTTLKSITKARSIVTLTSQRSIQRYGNYAN